MPLLNLDEMSQINRMSRLIRLGTFGLYSFCERDYLKDEITSGEELKQRVLRVTSDALKISLNPESTSVLLLSQWRFLGKVFNPISIFYIAVNDEVKYLCVEVSNTPWNERHVYCYELKNAGEREKWQSEKTFHVSPYNPMAMTYDWESTITDKCIQLGLRLKVGGELHFVASFDYQRDAFDAKRLYKGLIAMPFLSFHVVLGIYWQALKLFLKRIPIYNHPQSSSLEKKGG